MRAVAGRIAGIANWEAKKLLARHIWLDAIPGTAPGTLWDGKWDG